MDNDKHSSSTSSSPWVDQLPWNTRLMINAGSFALDACRHSDLIRRFFHFLQPRSPPQSINGVASSDVAVDPSRELWFRLYVPSSSAAAAATLPLIIYFHGGGFLTGAVNFKSFDDLCRKLAGELEAVVASINYRLAPDHRYPSPYDDGFETLKFIDAQNYAVLPSNTDLSRCFIAGDSAGGNIAHHVTVRAGKGEREFEKLNIIGLVAIQPFFGGEERTESELRLTKAPFLTTEITDWMWRSFLPQGSDRNHEAANVSFGGISAVKFPATVLIIGGFDPLQDWQSRYYEGLKKSEKEVELIEYPNAFHGFYCFPEFLQLWIAEVRWTGLGNVFSNRTGLGMTHMLDRQARLGLGTHINPYYVVLTRPEPGPTRPMSTPTTVTTNSTILICGARRDSILFVYLKSPTSCLV